MVANKAFIRKEVEKITGVPARRIQFYTENGALSVDKLHTGRGRERKYSGENILELLVINELAKRKVEFAESKRIVREVVRKYAPSFFDIDKLARSKGGHYIYIYEDGTVVLEKQKSTQVIRVDMRNQLSVLVLNVSALAGQVPEV